MREFLVVVVVGLLAWLGYSKWNAQPESAPREDKKVMANSAPTAPEKPPVQQPAPAPEQKGNLLQRTAQKEQSSVVSSAREAMRKSLEMDLLVQQTKKGLLQDELERIKLSFDQEIRKKTRLQEHIRFKIKEWEKIGYVFTVKDQEARLARLGEEILAIRSVKKSTEENLEGQIEWIDLEIRITEKWLNSK